MIKLWILLNSNVKLTQLDDYLLKSFTLVKSDKDAVVIKAHFKTVQDSILFCIGIKDQLTAVTELESEMKDWIISETW